MTDLSRARSIAMRAAEAAGDLVRNGLFQEPSVHEKGSQGDVVTDLDLAAEKLIIGAIEAEFPRHRIVSEEAGALNKASSWTWLIDPVDGTNNIVVGLPVLAIGIALCHHNAPVLSVVHDPVSRRTWSAILEQGAWSGDNRPMSMPEKSHKSGPIVAWMQGYSVTKDDRDALALKMVLSKGTHRVLDLWAPLTGWMMLARGDIDGIVGYRIGEIDLYAGALVASEVGLKIQDFSGIPFVFKIPGMGDRECILAGSHRVVAELAAMVSTAKRIAGRIENAVVDELTIP